MSISALQMGVGVANLGGVPGMGVGQNADMLGTSTVEMLPDWAAAQGLTLLQVGLLSSRNPTEAAQKIMNAGSSGADLYVVSALNVVDPTASSAYQTASTPADRGRAVFFMGKEKVSAFQWSLAIILKQSEPLRAIVIEQSHPHFIQGQWLGNIIRPLLNPEASFSAQLRKDIGNRLSTLRGQLLGAKDSSIFLNGFKNSREIDWPVDTMIAAVDWARTLLIGRAMMEKHFQLAQYYMKQSLGKAPTFLFQQLAEGLAILGKDGFRLSEEVIRRNREFIDSDADKEFADLQSLGEMKAEAAMIQVALDQEALSLVDEKEIASFHDRLRALGYPDDGTVFGEIYHRADQARKELKTYGRFGRARDRYYARAAAARRSEPVPAR